jgi:hypothetical protein
MLSINKIKFKFIYFLLYLFNVLLYSTDMLHSEDNLPSSIENQFFINQLAEEKVYEDSYFDIFEIKLKKKSDYEKYNLLYKTNNDKNYLYNVNLNYLYNISKNITFKTGMKIYFNTMMDSNLYENNKDIRCFNSVIPIYDNIKYNYIIGINYSF